MHSETETAVIRIQLLPQQTPGKISAAWSFMLTLLLVFSADIIYADEPEILPLASYENTILDSGGELMAEQAAYDVEFYDLDLFIETADSSIFGSAIIHIRVLEPLNKFVVHLDTVLTTERVILLHNDRQSEPMEFTHKNGLVTGFLPDEVQPGDQLDIEISYYGRPRTATNPPWEGGFTWSETDSGDPWVGVSCQMNGADIWWPVKDHPSDRADSVSLKATVPANLVAVSNGSLQSIEQYTDDTRTFHWATGYPINNYAVTLNIGPYEKLNRDYKSVAGGIVPFYFWVLPENRDKAESLLHQIEDHMSFFEELLGPYPFRREKYGVVESPFLGMEHQTLIAYGAGYENDVVFQSDSDFDDLHHHELAHEWWGNLITVYDWKDFWIHEGFGTYMQPLYAESLHGKEQYLFFMKKLYERISNNMPIAPRESRNARSMFDGRDIYMKGAWVLHTLRELLGDELFFKSLRRMIHPEAGPEKGEMDNTSRFVDTREYIDLVEDLADRDLGWFFDAYLRYAKLPELKKEWQENDLYLSWEVPSGKSFPMPIEVYDGKESTVIIPDGKTPLNIHDRATYRIDPDKQVLRKSMYE